MPSLKEQGLRLLALEEQFRDLEARLAMLEKGRQPDNRDNNQDSEELCVIPASVDVEVKTDGAMHNISAADVEHNMQIECLRPLEENIWEASIFLFLPQSPIGSLEQYFICVGLLINLVVQIGFSTILWSHFSKSQLPDVGHAQRWREVQGHYYGNMAVGSQSSMVSAMCNGDTALILSNTQQILYQSVGIYTQEGALHDWSLGALLCVMVLTVWFLYVAQEFAEICALVRALLLIPRGRSRVDVVHHTFMFTSISRARLFGVLGIMLIRLCIAGTLMVLGALWLTYTVDIKDLLLNSMALGFLLELDELVFATLVPLTAKILLRDLEPLNRPPPSGLTPLLAILGIVSLILVLYFAAMEPYMKQMDLLKTTLCGGDLDFVYDKNALGFYIVASTTPFGGDDPTAFARIVVQDSIDKGVDKTSLAFRVATMPALTNMASSDVPSTVNYVSSLLRDGCDDWDFQSGGQFFPAITATLQALTGLPDIKACADLADHCAGLIHFVRLACPVTCGCNSPVSGLYRDGIMQGCPINACRASSDYTSVLAQLPCEDVVPNSLANKSTVDAIRSDAMVTLVTQFAKAWSVMFPENAAMLMKLEQGFLVYGCGFYSLLPPDLQNLICTKNQDFSSIAIFCPVTCGCTNFALEGCPTTCLSQK